MKTESEGPQAYEDFIREEGCPTLLRRDNSKMQTGDDFTSINRHFCIKDGYTEPHHPHQNPAENHAARWLKHHAQTVMNITGAPDYVWPVCLTWIADVHNFTANEALGNCKIHCSQQIISVLWRFTRFPKCESSVFEDSLDSHKCL